MTWVVLIAVVLAALWGVTGFNRLIALKGMTLNAWKQIDVQLKRRHDLIPGLVKAVKGAMAFERETLEAVVAARNTALAARQQASPTGGVGSLAEAEAHLSDALSRLSVVVERYPELGATSNVAQLQEELTSTENRIAFARQHYNDTATTYNLKQHQFPWMLIAGMAGADPVELWEITDDLQRGVPDVNLSIAPDS